MTTVSVTNPQGSNQLSCTQLIEECENEIRTYEDLISDKQIDIDNASDELSNHERYLEEYQAEVDWWSDRLLYLLQEDYAGEEE